MASNRTLTMIKPDAVAAGNSGAIIDMIIKAGFDVKAMKLTQMSEKTAKAFYSVHAERPFFNDLIAFMTEGPIVAAILEKDNAVEDFRTLIGSTNSKEAAEGTVRAAYGTDIERNAVHGSDSDDNAMLEGNFHFSNYEQF